MRTPSKRMPSYIQGSDNLMAFNRGVHDEEHDDEEPTGHGLMTAHSFYNDGYERYMYPWVGGNLGQIANKSNGGLTAVPHWVGKTTYMGFMYADISVNATQPAGVMRLGIYKGEESIGWLPRDLVADFGTDTATTPFAVVDCSNQELEGGSWYWTVAVPQGSPATGPTVTCYVPLNVAGQSHQNMLGAFFGSVNQLSGVGGLFLNGVTGSLPDPFTVNSTTGFDDDDTDIQMSYFSVIGTGF